MPRDGNLKRDEPGDGDLSKPARVDVQRNSSAVADESFLDHWASLLVTGWIFTFQGHTKDGYWFGASSRRMTGWEVGTDTHRDRSLFVAEPLSPINPFGGIVY